MIKQNDYNVYFKTAAPSNLERLECLALNELKSIITENLPNREDLIYKEFIKALLEQINYFEINPELIDLNGSGGYTLGSYSESGFNKGKSNENINRISPMAYNILLNCGLICSRMGRM